MSNIYFLKIINNIIEMFEDRKYLYLGTNYEKIKSDIREIDNNINIVEKIIYNSNFIIRSKNHDLLFKSIKNNDYIVVLFLESFYKNGDNIDLNYIFKEISFYISRHPYYQLLNEIYIICPDEYEDQIKKKVNKEEYEIFKTMEYSRLSYNPTNHISFPNHEKIKNYEKKHKKYDLKLPILSNMDISSKWYNYKSNDIIKIIREDKKITHRIVKEDYLLEI